MNIAWFSFAWSLGIGVPLFTVACYFWRARLASSWVRRLVAAFLLGLAFAPTALGMHGGTAVVAAVFLSRVCIIEPAFGFFLVVLPIIVTTAILFSVWSTGVWIFRRYANRAA